MKVRSRDKQMAKELFFSVIIRTENMYGTGGVMFSANKFKGFIANDYLEGSYNEENGLLRFDLYEGIGATNELFENPQYVFKSAMVEIDELELPSAYFLQSTSNESITINIVERISDMKKIQYIKEQTDRAYKYMMPKI